MRENVRSGKEIVRPRQQGLDEEMYGKNKRLEGYKKDAR